MISELNSLITKVNAEGTYFATMDMFPSKKKYFVTFVPQQVNYIQSTTSPVERGFTADVYVGTIIGHNESHITLGTSQETYVKQKLFPIISSVGGFSVNNMSTTLDIAYGSRAIIHKFTLQY